MRCNLTLFKMLKSKKGISPILATLLLIVIAVAAIIVTYAWVMTYMGAQTQQAGALITTENVRWYGILSNGTLSTSAHNRTDITIRNIGTSTVKVVRVYLGTSPGNLPPITAYCTGINATIEPQKIATITIQWPIPSIGNTYTVGTTYYFNIATEPGTAYTFQNSANP
jgi:flagellin-like protein